MNNLKKLKLLVASALLSSTAVYADDCIDTSATNCGITISGNQTIDIDSSISTTENERGIHITSGFKYTHHRWRYHCQQSSVMRLGLN